MPARTIKRKINVRGVEDAVNVEIDLEKGISFFAKGSKKRSILTWERAVSAAQTPYDIPSFLAGDALALLAYQVKKATRKRG
jgi:hypothetical protein